LLVILLDFPAFPFYHFLSRPESYRHPETGEMYRRFEKIIGYLIGRDNDQKALSGINAGSLLRTEEKDEYATARNLVSAFLISLFEEHPRYREAREYLTSMQQNPSCKETTEFLLKGLSLIFSEVSGLDAKSSLWRALDRLDQEMEKGLLKPGRDTLDTVHSFFFPEGVSILKQPENMIRALRKKRIITLSRLNPDPIKNVAKEILFTSNILLTTPSLLKSVDPDPLIDSLLLKEAVRERLKKIIREEQIYWYDHPIQVGCDRNNNEVLYGLRELDRAFDIEIEQGTLPEKTKVNCVLSVSVTHKGLHEIAREYLEEELRSCADIRRLRIIMFTERDTRRLNEEVFLPAAKKFFRERDSSVLYEIFGVDGNYGRHYSFLKAVSAFWNVLIEPEIKGTFKIDLDQVFAQEELIKETGQSALEHFQTPLWGAEGLDSEGNRVELGMIAGTLVNRKDLEKSLFTPDFPFPSGEIGPEEWVFFSRLPQALSTEAEMMTRYTEKDLDGQGKCLQRIHVTGGTCGILVNSLRKYRPFTPSFIGRAEDQSYIMSVLFKEKDGSFLRYVHKDGLIMSHDKEIFTEEAIKSAKTGKTISDYARVLWFSHYAKILPWPVEKIKSVLDPFTGCFISQIPFTIVYLRLAFKAASLFQKNETEEGKVFLETGVAILGKIIGYLEQKPSPLIRQYRKEKEGWELYYDILDRIEQGLIKGDAFAGRLKKKAEALVEGCTIKCS
jgi:hypothetical protein